MVNKIKDKWGNTYDISEFENKAMELLSNLCKRILMKIGEEVKIKKLA